MTNSPLLTALEDLQDYLRLGFAHRDIIEETAKKYGVNPEDLKQAFLESLRNGN